jgi:hypothetical protein
MDVLETIVGTVEKIPAKAEPEVLAENPELPVTQTSGGIDLESLAGKPSTTPSKKQWNRGIYIDGNSKNATSPSAASTMTPFSPAADLNSSFAASPCHLDEIDESKTVPADVLEALQTLAEKYAQVKKTLGGDELTTALETIACATAAALREELPTFDGPDRVGAIESFLKDMVKPYVPMVNDELTSIGSIPNIQTGANFSVGLCRFHVKGKCFDGTLCRFCHLRREEHVRDGAGNTRQKMESPGDHMRRRMKPFTPSPQKMQAPLAIPLMLPKPAPMPMPLMLPVPTVPASQVPPSKPATKEQAGLCELLSSLRVETPEERSARGYLPDPTAMQGQQAPAAYAPQAQYMQQMQQMQHMQQMQYMQQMQQMQHMQQMKQMQQMSMMYSHGMDAAYGGWPQPQAEADPCPTVPPVASILARRPKSRRAA